MTVSAADARTVDQLLGSVLDGGLGKGCLSQWWPVTFLLGFALMEVRHQLRARAALPGSVRPSHRGN
jgi:hypothetical protein